jgi:4-amino-4-deoxy-L-arabinose transferase-like glycosyltransferase
MKNRTPSPVVIEQAVHEAAVRADDAAAAGTPTWYWFAMAGVLALSAALNGFRLDQERVGYPNYAATVLSMTRSWHNFLFASFDPGGFLAVDKPPLALWVQAAVAKLFGFGGMSVLAPQALAGVASVAVLGWVVRGAHGPLTGVLAALFLATSPITVAVNRTNLIDSQLVLTLLLAAGAMLKSVERGKLLWLLMASVMFGLACLTKSAQALLVAPALLLPLLLAPLPAWPRRLVSSGLALLVVAMVVFPWLLVVDSTPAAQRPYVGGSRTNSEWDLLVHFNGMERLGGTANANPTFGPAARYPGPPGPFRLLDRPLGGQLNWLLPLACAGLVLGTSRRHSRARSAWWLWAAWTVGPAILFSAISAYLPYYLATMTPGLAALEAIGLASLCRHARGGRSLPLAGVLVATAALQIWLLGSAPAWNARLAPFVLVCVLTALTCLLVGKAPLTRRRRGLIGSQLLVFGILAGVMGQISAPLIWAALPGWEGLTYRDMPYAGPSSGAHGSTHPAATPENIALLRYLETNRGSAHFLVATPDAYSASPLILASGQPVLTIGGYTGHDLAITVDELGRWVERGIVRFFLVPLPDTRASTLLPATNGPSAIWQTVVAACPEVLPAAWQQPDPAHTSGPESRSGSANTVPGSYSGYGWENLQGLALFDCKGSGPAQ